MGVVKVTRESSLSRVGGRKVSFEFGLGKEGSPVNVNFGS